MRYGDFEVQLQLSLDEKVTTLEEKRIGQKTYAIAEPDNEYVVKVTVYQNSLQQNIAKHLRIGVYVDGVDCNYWKRIDTDNLATCTTFKGFKIGADELRAFVFASPSSDGTSQGSGSTPASAGSVRVEVFECVPDSGMFMNRAKKYSTPTGAQIAPDSKFYQQPSVTTKSGRNLNAKEKFEPLIRWKNRTHLSSIVLHYHTKEVIDFFAEAQANNIHLDIPAACGMKRSASSIVVDLTEDDDDDIAGVCNGTSKMRPDGADCYNAKQERNTCSNGENESRQSGTQEEIAEEDEEDDDIQHVPMIKHIPCLDLSGDTAQQEVSYIRKEY